jgi:hypothetical protein
MPGSLALRPGEDHLRRLQVGKYSYPTEKRQSASVLLQIGTQRS